MAAIVIAQQKQTCRNAVVFFSSVVAFTLVAVCCNARAVADGLRVGFAEADITPPQGYPMAGYYHERLASGVKDPLKAKAMVLIDGKERAAIVVCDLIGISRDLSVVVRQRVTEKLGIAAEHIVLTGTHSHTAPDYSREFYEFAATLKPRSDGKPAYATKLVEGIVSAVVRASENAEAVTIQSGSATQSTPVSFNRRFVMRDGSVRTWMSLKSDGVVRAAGPIDPELPMAVMRSEATKKPRGVFSNFALHLDTVGGSEWSADYPRFIEQAVRQELGDDVVSIFGTGTCGDINHVDPERTERNKTDVIGQSLGQTLVQALPKLQDVSSTALRVRSGIVKVPMQAVSEPDVRRSEQLLKLIQEGGKVEFLDQVLAYKTIMLDHLQHRPSFASSPNLISWGLSKTWAGVGAELPVEVTAICVGEDLAIVCLPGEIFVDLGLAIKRGSPFRTTMVVELANCVETIYVPTRAAYAGGSYEVTNSALRPGSGEMLVEEALRLLRDASTVKK